MNYGVTGDLFAEQEAHHEAQEQLDRHRHLWWICWGWDGPRAGAFCEVNSCVAEQEEGGKIYCYMELCRLVELRPDGKWLAVIEMGEVHGEPWPKDGTRLLLGELDIWPPVKILRKARWADSEEGAS